MPRQPEYAGYTLCYRCQQGVRRYGHVIDELMPITYTAYDWSLGAGLRRLKDEGCRPDTNWAAGFGAILSAYLEHHLPGWGPYDCIVPVPTTAPVIAASLARASAEGWWTPEVTQAASIKDGSRRQRERANGDDRGDVPIEKWVIDRAALGGCQRALIVDDMMSTGGSLFSFAKALRGHGVRRVDAVVAARNVGQGTAPWLRPLLEARVADGHPWAPQQSKPDVLGTPAFGRTRGWTPSAYRATIGNADHANMRSIL